MTEVDPTNKMAKIFVWLAWIIALALLMFFFQDVLDEQYNPNTQPEMRLTAGGQAEVILAQNRQGHYVARGTINDTPVTFLLDTGATQVSIPAHIADKLGLVAQGNYRVQTANGSITVYKTEITQLSLGNIFLYNVAAHINPAMKSDEILLGMSALKQVDFQQTGKQLILREPL
ncbi:MAG: TIGR02281 family clan AA aspartic protease [Colwellia sp.]|uniref:retropepsin-like aspartic protease family protein n=1 Tax=Colwellia sp. TaxID=56799 RepID=UPI001D328939|nr:TIGR02281 family clan AA aspartic protease [Colwellia sp.]MCJ8294264.1 TIGR02281 family clan AA aspartic protease [Colwellia sp.]NQY47521.1 TIGR02281 family clan AA aspartic protease [Colwellia sp.]